MSIFFISDVHLGETFPEREKQKKKKLLSFLDMVAKNARQLFIVGDLFDFWFEYKHAVPKQHLQVILKLADLHNKGIQLKYITGNHDFWLGSFLSEEIGFKIYRGSADIVLDSKKLHITHGDGLAKNDGGYRLLKRILQNRLNIFLYRLITPDIGIPLAKFVSGMSRGHTQKRPKESFLDEYRKYALGKLQHGFNAVIIAHTHVPEEIRYEEGVYFNTGDWVENYTYIEYSEGEFTLKRWD
jgi:UDP-2,3-diacylglucosamine hydrolase